jgi:hypothetical protein
MQLAKQSEIRDNDHTFLISAAFKRDECEPWMMKRALDSGAHHQA